MLNFEDEVDQITALLHDVIEDQGVTVEELACRIKEADVKDNMKHDRLQVITKEDLVRLQKYQKSLDRIRYK